MTPPERAVDLLGRAGTAVAAVLLLAAVLTTAIVAAPGAVGADASYVVLSDSMAPTLTAGDVVVVRAVDPAVVSTGDVITYQSPTADAAGARRVSHRVVDVDGTGSERTFRTKGDANDQPDPYRVPESAVSGRVWFVLPYVGYLVQFAGTTAGLVALVVLPGVSLVVSELYSLYRDAAGDRAR